MASTGSVAERSCPAIDAEPKEASIVEDGANEENGSDDEPPEGDGEAKLSV